jgi:hypothetical protein
MESFAMTKEEIIEMARQVGFFINDELTITSPFIEDICISPMLKEFAKLVAEKERNACMKIVMQGTGEPIQRKTLDILHQERTRIALAIKEQE